MKNPTSETMKLQNIIKELLNEIGWSTKHLVKKICDDRVRRGEPDSDIDENTEYEKIKKQLSRTSTSPHILNSLIQFILSDKEVMKSSMVRLPSINPEYFSDNEMKILQGIASVSKDVFEQENCHD